MRQSETERAIKDDLVARSVTIDTLYIFYCEIIHA